MCLITTTKSTKFIQLKEKLPPSAIKYKPKANTLEILTTLIETCLSDLLCALESKPRSIFSFNLLIKALHVLIRQYPVLSKAILGYNCQRFVKKFAASCLKGGNNTFLSVLIRAVVYFTGDKLRNLLFEACLDNSIS
jgi:hypothetical protein